MRFLGLMISSIGFIGFLYISPNTSSLELLLWSFIIGIGSGMFFSPNTHLIMNQVTKDKRGIASGIRTMMINAGMMISFGLAIPVLSHAFSIEKLFYQGTIDLDLPSFIKGLRMVFAIAFVLNVTASVLSSFKGASWKEATIDQ